MMEECTCNREADDLDEDEHYISCPVILTPEVLRLMGFAVREVKESPELIIKRRNNMAKNGLVREDLKEVDPTIVSGAIRELAIKSRSILGYKLVHSIVTRPTTLREVLKNLGFAPFSKRSVEIYKAKKLRAAQLELKKAKDNEREARWSLSLIQSYSEPIPESVLHKAIQIKEAMPEVKLQIEQLTVTKPDPFLVASHENERFYVDVWDEPQFEDAILRGAHIVKEDDYDED
jgi:hypothetical protein